MACSRSPPSQKGEQRRFVTMPLQRQAEQVTSGETMSCSNRVIEPHSSHRQPLANYDPVCGLAPDRRNCAQSSCLAAFGSLMASYRTRAALHAAGVAQERMQEYLRDMAHGVIDADPQVVKELVGACEWTFKQWMASCGEFNVH